MNSAMLGVITAPHAMGIEILYVLSDSPADATGLAADDVLTQVGSAVLAKPADLDAALKDVQPGAPIALEWMREGEKHKGEATVVNWRTYRGSFLRGRARGQVGFPAPDWYAYAWAQVDEEAGPPTRKNTAGKVVVIHAFQAW